MMSTSMDDEYTPAESPDTEEYEAEGSESSFEVDPVDRAEQEDAVQVLEDFLDEDDL